MSFVTDYVTYGEPRICLIAKTGEILCLPLKDYALFLREAKRFGWNPQGVRKHRWIERRDIFTAHEVDYFIEKNGLITDVDAMNIAIALRKMREHANRDQFKNSFEIGFHNFYEDADYTVFHGDFDFSGSEAIEIIRTINGYLIIRPRNPDVYLCEYKSETLKNFIDLCELGEFQIGKIS